MAMIEALTGKNDVGAGSDVRLAVFVNDQRSEETLRNLIENQSIAPAVVRRGNCRDAVHYLKRNGSPRMIIIDVSGSEMPLSEMDEAVSICGPNVVIIAVGVENDISLYRDLMVLGVADYVVKPVTPEVFRRVLTIQGGGAAARGQRRQRTGKLICVTGARGGVGTSTLATNLGWVLAGDAGRRTAIVDLDLQCGSVTTLMGLRHSPGFVEALLNPHRVDDLFLDRVMVKKSDKLMVLGAEEPLEDDADFDPAALDAVLRNLRQRFHYVLMDLPRRPGTLYRQVLERAEVQIILATPTLTALRDAMRISRLIGREDMGQRALLVLNRFSPTAQGAIAIADFEKTIGRRVDYELPFSRHALASDNGGDMLVRRDTAYGAAVNEIVTDLLGRAPAKVSAVKRLFRRGRK